MTLYLDTEFNGHGGELISLALVSDKSGEFYSVLPAPEKWDDWCLKHVVPFLEQASEPENEFRMRLRHFLEKHSGEEIIADWPDDFVHLMQALSGPSYDQSYMLPVSMRLVVSGDVQPEVPHNALSDAKALMYWHLHHKSHMDF